MRLGQMTVAELVERVFIFVVLLLLTDVRMEVGSDEVIEGNPYKQVIFSAIYVVVLCMLAFRWRRVERVVSREAMLWVFLGFVLLSVLWSAAPAVTLRRCVALAGTTLIGIYLATRFSLREQLSLLAWALTAAMILSVACVLALPEIGIHHDPDVDLWQGIYMNKNVLGRLMVLTVLLMAVLLQQRWTRMLPWLGAMLALVLLLMTRSKTSLVVLLAVLAMLPIYRALRHNYFLAMAVILLLAVPGIVVSVWFFNNLEIVMGALGKDLTLTGRTDLWSAVMDMIERQPWFGYGFSGFWRGWDGPSAQVCHTMNQIFPGWIPPHAHDGFLDLWLDLGLVGLALFALSYGVAFFRAVSRVHHFDGTEGVWPLVYFTFLILFSFTESTILRINSVFWALYVSALLTRPAADAARAATARATGGVLPLLRRPLGGEV